MTDHATIDDRVPIAGRTLGADEVAAHVARIAEVGYTVVPDVIDPGFVDAVNDDLLRLEDELAIVPATNEFEGSHTVRIYNLLVHGGLYEAIPVHPGVLPVV